MRLTGKKIAANLKQRGYKLTPQRCAVLKVITRSREHLAPVAIHEEARKCHIKVGLVTVYRTLEILAELGLICEVHTGGRQRNYVMRRPVGHHHHLICSDCGKVVDFAACDLDELEHKLSQKTGFKIESHILELHGRCPQCCEVASV